MMPMDSYFAVTLPAGAPKQQWRGGWSRFSLGRRNGANGSWCIPLHMQSERRCAEGFGALTFHLLYKQEANYFVLVTGWYMALKSQRPRCAGAVFRGFTPFVSQPAGQRSSAGTTSERHCGNSSTGAGFRPGFVGSSHGASYAGQNSTPSPSPSRQTVPLD